MPIIYAAPFVFLSILSFAACLCVPRLRRFAIPALTIPVTFAVCSLAGWISFVLIAQFVLKVQFTSNSVLLWVSEGVAFYVLPGVLGSWAAVRVIAFADRFLLRSQFARDLVFRSVVSIVASLMGGIISLGVAGSMLPNDSFRAFVLAIAGAVLSGAGAFLLTITIQRRARHKAELVSSPQGQA